MIAYFIVYVINEIEIDTGMIMYAFLSGLVVQIRGIDDCMHEPGFYCRVAGLNSDDWINVYIFFLENGELLARHCIFGEVCGYRRFFLLSI